MTEIRVIPGEFGKNIHTDYYYYLDCALNG